MASNYAVLVQNAYKSYGTKEVLIDFNMQVKKGSIYGLLGASGCGKTTLLSCVVGRRQLNSGEIYVLGGKPGLVGSGVPGPKVGYMPQETALVGAFTVKDSIFYFGRIYDMPEKLIEERFNELSKLLDLPPADRYIRNCSGGQQRRVSFAASMVHMPKLLILDEPTAGVDPILRERIWDYLVEITTKSDMAVIITTHYIEEARQANSIGLMRNGRLLAEESPEQLLTMFQCELLEDVFLILCQRQNEGRLNAIVARNNMQNSNGNVSVISLDTTQGSTDMLANKPKAKKEKRVSGYSLNSKRVQALLDKNWKQFYRNIAGVVFTLLFPIVQNVFFLLAIGGDVKDINLAIVNSETLTTRCPNFTTNGTAIPYSFTSCHIKDMSCRFLEYLEHPMIHKVYYENLDDAIDAIRHDNVVGALYMSENFTESLEERWEKGRNIDDDVLTFSEIKVWLDMSNRQVGYTIKYKLLQLYIDFQKDVFRDCNLDPRSVEFLELETFYGKKDDSFTLYMTPGLIMTIMFFMMVVMTSQIIITDRAEGVWDRSVIAGVTSLEISLTHTLLQTGIVFIYTLETLIITFFIFRIKYIGDLFSMGVIAFLQGLAGLAYGFWISIISVNTTMANIMATGSFYIMILLCGLMWPIEGMPVFLQYISKCMPFTIAIESLRNVMTKGWTLSNLQVLNGIGVEIIWIVLLGVINTVLIRKKR